MINKKPNILFVTTDQQRGDCLGIEQSSHPVMTPHMDQLAHEGVRFERAYSDCPICIPARATIMTGRSAYNHGIANMTPEAMSTSMPEKPKQTLPGRLTVAGYQTQAVGKMHFYPARGRNGFENMTLHPEDYVNWLESSPYPGAYRGHGLGGNEVYPTFSAVPTDYTHTHWVVEESISFIRERDPNCPFFMWTSFEAPHPPYDPPEEYVRLYDDMDIPPPVSGDWSQDTDIPFWMKNERWNRKLDLLPDAVVQSARKHYYAQITHIDYELGRLFGELKSQGLWEDTIVIFTSDHGDMLGDHGMFHKTCLYDPSARVPFILRIPDKYNSSYTPGSTVKHAVQLADIYPTVLDFAGCASEEDESTRDGVSLVSSSDDTLANRWVNGYVDVTDGLYMLTNGVWKYIYYVCGGHEQLFHIDNDPNETVNLVGNDQFLDILSECRHKLVKNFPNLSEGSNKSDTGLRLTDVPPTDEKAVRANNSFAWRGPIRYGGGY